MSEEERFEEWFQGYRIASWQYSRPDRKHEPPSEAYCMGLRGHFLTGWLARAAVNGEPRK